MDLATLGATQLARMIAAGEITSTEVIDACIARIDAVDENVQAWAFLDRDFAREQAAKLDALRATGAPTGPLHGIPVGIKDIFDTKDFPTENGSVLDRGRQPMTDSAAVRLLKSAGAVIMGKTVTTEFAVFSPGKTRNPQDPARTPGGSSSGSAAAVASGMVPLAIGSQTNGSVIRPASFCGIVGFKPSHGRISRAGAMTLSRVLDHVGVFARSVEDAALIAECLMVHDPADSDTRPSAAPHLSEIAAQEPPTEPRFAFVKTPVWSEAEAATQAAFGELRDFLGDSCDEVTMPDEFETAVGNLRAIMYADLARYLDRYMKRDETKISEILRDMIQEGSGVHAVDYNRAVDQIPPLRAWIDELSNAYDAIVTPATPGEAPLGLEATGNPIFCSTWSYLGVPALSLPVMEGENGMPLGLQLIGPYGDDGRLLRTCHWLLESIVRQT
jgi:Asp-tRNA(Asn)/Glu-tRNA(Gln) amidotransferase A subunit family amidase